MKVIKAALGDATVTSIWVFCIPSLRVLTSKIATFFGIQPHSLSALFITTILVTILVFLISLIGKILGGAGFNPTTTASFYAAGLRPDTTLSSMAVRFPAQATGGAVGAMAILKFMPTQYKHMLKGPSLKVDLHTGAIVEGVLTFVLNLAILFVMVKGPKNPILKVYLLAVATVGLIIPGASYTGPSLNPANAFGWAYMNNKHNTWEQFYVYWISPFIGAILAAWTFRFLFMSPLKQKKA